MHLGKKKMKNIGIVRYTTTDSEYAGGSIVMLSERETTLLVMLQDAWDSGIFRWAPSGNTVPNDIEMSGMFNAIRAFVQTKYAINAFKNATNSLDSLLKEGHEENV